MTCCYVCVSHRRSILQKDQICILIFIAFGSHNLQHDSYSSINLGTCSLLSLHLLVHWACGKIVLPWMLMASFELMFPCLWGPCIFWQFEYDLWVTYIFFSFSCQKTTSDSFKFRALDLVEKRNLQSLVGDKTLTPSPWTTSKGYYFEWLLLKELLFIYLHCRCLVYLFFTPMASKRHFE